jgi:hypothetical protein
MSLQLISAAFFILAVFGLFLAYTAIKLGIRIIKVPTYLELPYLSKKGTFHLPQNGSFTIWQKGKQRMLTPVDQFKPVITNTLTGDQIELTSILLFRVTKTDLIGNISIQLFRFKAQSGNYLMELLPGRSITQVEQNLSKPLRSIASSFDPARYSILVTKYQSPLLVFGFVWSILLSIAFIVSGLIFGINPDFIVG